MRDPTNKNPAEVRLLAELCGHMEWPTGNAVPILDDGDDSYMAELDPNGNKFIEFLATEGERAKKRAGTLGPHCYFCGSEVDTRACGCKYQKSFGCAGRKVCAECRTGMHLVADHCGLLFSYPFVNRVSGRKDKAFHLLRLSAMELGESDPDSRGTELHSQLYQQAFDAFEMGDKSEFREAVLSAFKQVQFSAWKSLGAELQKHLHVEAKKAFIKLLKAVKV